MDDNQTDEIDGGRRKFLLNAKTALGGVAFASLGMYEAGQGRIDEAEKTRRNLPSTLYEVQDNKIRGQLQAIVDEANDTKSDAIIPLSTAGATFLTLQANRIASPTFTRREANQMLVSAASLGSFAGGIGVMSNASAKKTTAESIEENNLPRSLNASQQDQIVTNLHADEKQADTQAGRGALLTGAGTAGWVASRFMNTEDTPEEPVKRGR